MDLDLLAFAAHRDDIEITCGGALIRAAEQGYKTGACDLSQGEMGTLGSAPERKAESEEAARILGLAVRVNAELPDSGLFNVREQQLKLVEILRRHRPKAVIIPGPEQRHPDHRVTPQLVFDACFFAGLEKFEPGLGGAKFRPRKIYWCHTQFEAGKPGFILDLSPAQLDRKIAAVLAYGTQFPDREKIAELLRARARAYGMMAGTTFGEGYTQRETMQVDDLLKIPGASI
jgi:bacillithiol biosynthesis deacetylase BshB1